MSLSTTFALITNQLQFIGLLSEADVQYPEGMDTVLAWFNFANFDPSPYLGNETDFPIVNFRLLFVIVSIMLPIVITILIMLLFVATHIVFIYAAFTTGVLLIFVWVISTFVGVTVGTSDDSFLVIGLVLVSVATLVALMVYLINRFYVTEEEKQIGKEDKLRQDRESARKFHRDVTLLRLLASVAFVLTGLILMKYVDVNLTFTNLGTILNIVGIALLCIGVIIFISFILALFERGRSASQKVQDFIERYGLVVLLGLINASFVPAMSYCATVFLCYDYVCDAGKVFNPNAYREDGNYDTTQGLYCDSCNFKNTDTCGSADNASVLCPGGTRNQNWRNPDVPCDDSVAILFFFAAGIVLAIYAIAVPLLFFLTSRYLTTEIMLSVRLAFPTRTNNPREDERDNWRKKLILVRPTAATLYEAFAYDNRYFILIMLAHRVFVALIMTIVSPYNTYASLVVATIIHLIMFVALMYTRPYLNVMEQGLSVVLAALNVVNGLFVLALKVLNTDAPMVVTIVFFIVNTVVPTIVAMVLFKIAVMRERSSSDEKTELEAQQRNAVADDFLDETDATVDTEITQLSLDRYTRETYLSYTFMLGGVFFFIACALSLVGILQADLPRERISTSPLQRGLDFSLSENYNSWDNMTSSCCCLVTAHPTFDFLVAERWVCPSVVLERGRITKDLLHNGTAIRPVCSTDVYTGCSISVVQSRLQLVCTDAATKELQDLGVSDRALEYYF